MHVSARSPVGVAALSRCDAKHVSARGHALRAPLHISACGYARRRAPPASALAWAGDEIDPFDASEALSAGTTTALDVRQPGEYRLDGHIAGSGNVAAFDWEHGFYVPHAGFEDEVADAYGREAPLLLCCSDGVRSRSAASLLEAAGFSSCAVLAGGLRAWEAEELPVEIEEDGEGGLVGAWV